MKKIALVIVLALGAWACAGLSSQYRLGTQSEMNKKWDEAIQYYEKASLENPEESVYRLALDRAKFSASLYHLQEGRRYAALGKKEEAKAAYAKAVFYNPRDPAIVKEAQAATAEAPKEAAPKSEKIEFPIKLKSKEESLMLKFPVETSLKSIFLALGKTAGISLVFDEQFRDIPFTTDLTNMTVEKAIRSLCMATKNFYRILDERTVMIIPDQQMKRLQYEVNCIRTFYISNVGAQEMLGSLSTMLRSPTKVPSIIADKTLNTLTIRGTPQEVELAEKLIRLWDKPKGEVVIDLEIMEVSRLKLRQLGVSFDQNTIGLRYGAPPASTGTTTDTTSGWFNLKGLDFSKAENFSISLPVSFLQFLESDTDTKVIAQPRLRGLSDEEMRHLVGQKIPIPRTTFSPFAAGGYASQPLTNFEQQDVGIEIKIKPTVHQEGEVTLALELKVTSIGGKGYADIPIINTREVKNTFRLRDGETNLIAGLLRDEERKTLKGIPWLKDLPVLGRLFGAEDTSLEQTDVILMITPYIIRRIPMNADDAKPIWVDVDEPMAAAGAGGFLEADILDRELDMRGAERALQSMRPQARGTNQVSLSPVNIELRPKIEFRIAVNLNTDQEIGNMSLVINYDPKLMNLKDVAEGGLTRQFGEKAPFLKNIDNGSGVCTIGFSSPQPGKGIKGGGTLATLLFESKGPGEGLISVSNVMATSASGTSVNLTTGQSRIVIR
ncbi:MAG: secretin N-terminal domain-containing protein [Candidatus Aminicenantes bacterium]|nr:secretin N-terminal domain-containing protein [Candidatus Aminicenantes bacterium]